MWPGKPIENMTLEEKNKFWHLFRGKCWHEWEAKHYSWDSRYGEVTLYDCKKCKITDGEGKMPYYYKDLSGFQIIKEHMEKELPEVWERYLTMYLNNPPVYPKRRQYNKFTIAHNKTLSLDNILDYLLENTEEWGWEECTEHRVGWPDKCKCRGTRKVKHPALLFAESLKEEE
jgi:hypothetical protein